MCMAVGKVSFDDCDMFTSSFGCTGDFEPMTPPIALPRPAGRWSARHLPVVRLSASLLLVLSAVGSLAQTPYKVVSPDGKVTYTDRPVSAQPGMQVQPLKRDAISGAAASGPPLP